MLLDAVLHTHAWASGRFKRRTQLESQKLEDQHLKIIKTEEEQGMCSPTPSSSTSAFSFSFSSSVWTTPSMLILATLEKTRGSLADFVTKMKNALAALTGIEA